MFKNNKIILSILILFVLLVFITILIYYLYKFNVKLEKFIIYPKSEDTLLCYQALYDISKLFEKHNIEYYIVFGTLLGAVRHKGLVPWDDDIDIIITENSKEILLSNSFKKSLHKKKYDIEKVSWSDAFYKIYSIDGTARKNMKVKFPFIDVFIEENINNKIKTKTSLSPGDECYFLKDELYPLKKYKFGKFEVNGPNNPYMYLNRCYGDDWNEVKYQEYDHKNEKNIEKIKTKLTEEDRKPGMPMEPIRL